MTYKMPPVTIRKEILEYTRDLFDQLLNERLEVAWTLKETVRLIETGRYTKYRGKPEGFEPNENRAELVSYMLSSGGVEMFGESYSRWDGDDSASRIRYAISWEDLGDGWLEWAQKRFQQYEALRREFEGEESDDGSQVS